MNSQWQRVLDGAIVGNATGISATFWTLACTFAAMSLSFGGQLPHTTGTYTLAMIASSVGLVATCIGFLLLPRYSPIVREEN